MIHPSPRTCAEGKINDFFACFFEKTMVEHASLFLPPRWGECMGRWENAEFAHFMQLTRGLRDRMGRGGPRGNCLAPLKAHATSNMCAHCGLRLGPTRSSCSAVSRLESSSRVTRPGKQLLRAWSLCHCHGSMPVWVGNARQAFVSAGGDPQPRGQG